MADEGITEKLLALFNRYPDADSACLRELLRLGDSATESEMEQGMARMLRLGVLSATRAERLWELLQTSPAVDWNSDEEMAELKTFESQVQALEGKVSELPAADANLRSDLIELKETVTDLEGKLLEGAQEIESLSAQLQRAEALLEEVRA